MPHTTFAASLAVDMSGSMGEHIHSGALFDASMVLGDTFEMLDVPYDVRAFGSHEVQFISMGDTSLTPDLAAGLAEANLGGTRMADAAGLAQEALQARPEHNRIFVSLTDGALTIMSNPARYSSTPARMASSPLESSWVTASTRSEWTSSMGAAAGQLSTP